MRYTAVRLVIVALLIPLVYGAAIGLRTSLNPPRVDMPEWTFNEMPLQLGDWRGRDAELDPETALATGAKKIVDRIYQDDLGHSISVHTAIFDRPEEGVTHAPTNCYRTAGWERVSVTTNEELRISDDLSIPVCVCVLRKDTEKAIVVYWYQLGEHVLFGRWDLGFKVRMTLAGRPAWPALIKVMLHIPANDLEDSKSAVLSFAEQVARWENQPAHRNAKGMLGTADSPAQSASAEVSEVEKSKDAKGQ